LHIHAQPVPDETVKLTQLLGTMRVALKESATNKEAKATRSLNIL